MILKKIVLSVLLGASSLSVLADAELAVIASLNVQRYMGTWYEVAKYPNRFQKNCASNTSATSAALSGCTSVAGQWRATSHAAAGR